MLGIYTLLVIGTGAMSALLFHSNVGFLKDVCLLQTIVGDTAPVLMLGAEVILELGTIRQPARLLVKVGAVLVVCFSGMHTFPKDTFQGNCQYFPAGTCCNNRLRDRK